MPVCPLCNHCLTTTKIATFHAKNAHTAPSQRLAANSSHAALTPTVRLLHTLYATTAQQPYIVLRCKHYLGDIGACGCRGCKSCCDTFCVGAACWDGFGVLADLGIGSFGNGFLRFGCAVFTFTPSMSRASSAIVLANNLSTSKRTAACSLFVMPRIAFKARCTSAKAVTAPPPYVQNQHPKTVSTSLPKSAARFFYA